MKTIIPLLVAAICTQIACGCLIYDDKDTDRPLCGSIVNNVCTKG